MAEPKTPPRPPLTDQEDAGFPPICNISEVADGEGDGVDDLEGDYHEDGGGD